MKSRSLRFLTVAALLCAAQVLVTGYVLHIPIGVAGGYVHLGDTVLFLTAAMLPLPFALPAAVIGGALADLLTGAAIWALPTAVIKLLAILPFAHGRDKLCSRRNLWALPLAGLIGVLGYGAATAVLFGWAATLPGLIPDVVQEAVSAALYLPLAAALDRAQVTRFFS